MRSLGVERGDLQPLAQQCTKVLCKHTHFLNTLIIVIRFSEDCCIAVQVWVWHTRTERAATPKLEHIRGQPGLEDTNLPSLYSGLHAI